MNECGCFSMHDLNIQVKESGRWSSRCLNPVGFVYNSLIKVKNQYCYGKVQSYNLEVKYPWYDILEALAARVILQMSSIFGHGELQWKHVIFNLRTILSCILHAALGARIQSIRVLSVQWPKYDASYDYH